MAGAGAAAASAGLATSIESALAPVGVRVGAVATLLADVGVIHLGASGGADAGAVLGVVHNLGPAVRLEQFDAAVMREVC